MSEPRNRIDATQRWLLETVLGLDLCPFARQPWRSGRVRIVEATGQRPEDWLASVLGEGELLLEADRGSETSLVLLPDAVGFEALLDLHAAGEALLEAVGLDAELQLVPFHPAFRFEDAEDADPANGVNRSPHPLLHLLRAEAVAQAAAAIDVPRLTARNAALLRERAASSGSS